MIIFFSSLVLSQHATLWGPEKHVTLSSPQTVPAPSPTLAANWFFFRLALISDSPSSVIKLLALITFSHQVSYLKQIKIKELPWSAWQQRQKAPDSNVWTQLTIPDHCLSQFCSLTRFGRDLLFPFIFHFLWDLFISICSRNWIKMQEFEM